MTMPQSDGGAVRRAPRWMWIVLILSVAINLLVAGMIIATALHFRAGPHGPRSAVPHFVTELPQARQNELRAIFEARRERSRELRATARKTRRAAREAFGDVPLDKDVLRARVSEATEARIALARERGVWITTIAGKLSVEERREYMRWLRHHRRFRKRWRRHSQAD